MKEALRQEILGILENNAKTSVEEMAMMLNVSAEEIEAEIAKLENEQVIVKYMAVVDRQKLPAEEDMAEALIEVKITPQRDYGYDDLAKRIYKYDEVVAVYLMAGTYDLAVRIQSRGMKDISKFVFEKLAVLDGVTSTVTLFIMRKYKEAGVVLVKDEGDDRLAVTP